jgi:hypothetical protein
LVFIDQGRENGEMVSGGDLSNDLDDLGVGFDGGNVNVFNDRWVLRKNLIGVEMGWNFGGN